MGETVYENALEEARQYKLNYDPTNDTFRLLKRTWNEDGSAMPAVCAITQEALCLLLRDFTARLDVGAAYIITVRTILRELDHAPV
jgi:hypothetical protein